MKLVDVLPIKASGFTIYIKNFLLYFYVLGDILDVAVQKSDFCEIILWPIPHFYVAMLLNLSLNQKWLKELGRILQCKGSDKKSA